MRFKPLLLVLGGVLVVASAFMIVSTGHSQDDTNPHAMMVQDYQGPETCLACHPTAGQEVAESVHYTNLGPAPFVVDWPEDKLAGMWNTF